MTPTKLKTRITATEVLERKNKVIENLAKLAEENPIGFALAAQAMINARWDAMEKGENII